MSGNNNSNSNSIPLHFRMSIVCLMMRAMDSKSLHFRSSIAKPAGGRRGCSCGRVETRSVADTSKLCRSHTPSHRAARPRVMDVRRAARLAIARRCVRDGDQPNERARAHPLSIKWRAGTPAAFSLRRRRTDARRRRFRDCESSPPPCGGASLYSSRSGSGGRIAESGFQHSTTVVGDAAATAPSAAPSARVGDAVALVAL